MIVDLHVGGAMVVGDALIDEVVAEDGTAAEIVGGAGLNVAVGLRRLGVPATLLAMVGDDAAGRDIRDHLSAHGVALIASPSAFGSSRAVSTRNSAGEPTYVFNDAAMNRVVDFTSNAAPALAAAAVVVVSCFPFDNREQSAELLDAVRSGAGIYVVDPNARPAMTLDKPGFVAEFEKHASVAWIVKISDEDADYMYGTSAQEAARRLLGLGTKAVVATYGAGGAEVFLPGDSVRVPIAALPGPVVDTMGAGDATIATVVAEVLHGGFHSDLATWEAMLSRAMMNAAATCRRAGALLQTA